MSNSYFQSMCGCKVCIYYTLYTDTKQDVFLSLREENHDAGRLRIVQIYNIFIHCLNINWIFLLMNGHLHQYIKAFKQYCTWCNNFHQPPKSVSSLWDKLRLQRTRRLLTLLVQAISLPIDLQVCKSFQGSVQHHTLDINPAAGTVTATDLHLRFAQIH